MIVKNIPYATLEIDINSGVIWLNGSSTCILRISNLNFNKINEKFTMIDINGIQANMKQEDENIEEDKEFSNFLEEIIFMVSSKISFLEQDKRSSMLKNILEKFKKVLDDDNT